MNESITALKILIDAGESGDYVTGFKELTDGSGYTITFAKAGTITIRHGAKGDDGIKGEDGADGTPGNDGENGSDGTPGNDGAPGEPGNPGQPGQPGDKGENGVVPLVSVKQDTDGEWYWAVSVGSQEKTFILDDNGQKVTAKGKDGITPVVGVNAAGNWTIDMGTGPVEITDDSGNLFRAKGEDGDPLFESVKKVMDTFYSTWLTGLHSKFRSGPELQGQNWKSKEYFFPPWRNKGNRLYMQRNRQ